MAAPLQPGVGSICIRRLDPFASLISRFRAKNFGRKTGKAWGIKGESIGAEALVSRKYRQWREPGENYLKRAIWLTRELTLTIGYLGFSPPAGTIIPFKAV
jgi:hypothetical protein